MSCLPKKENRAKSSLRISGNKGYICKRNTQNLSYTKNGKTYINATPDYDEYEVDVPATEYFYDVTYQCSKCGHKEIQRESRTQKN